MAKQTHTLTIVGSGIKSIAHFTTEAQAFVIGAARLLYLVNDVVVKAWLLKANPQAESLEPIYHQPGPRKIRYQAIVDRILAELSEHEQVCVLFYGHPCIYASSTVDAAKQARMKGYTVNVLPAISAQACLFADLLIDPGTCGCVSFDATYFLVKAKRPDITSHLILWQVGALGELGTPQADRVKSRLPLLVNYLASFYGETHEVILYEAATRPLLPFHSERVTIADLKEVEVARVATLYIPPAQEAQSNAAIIKELQISFAE